MVLRKTGMSRLDLCLTLFADMCDMCVVQMPFEVGEEVMFRPKANEMIEGIVVDVGWYRCVAFGRWWQWNRM